MIDYDLNFAIPPTTVFIQHASTLHDIRISTIKQSLSTELFKLLAKASGSFGGSYAQTFLCGRNPKADIFGCWWHIYNGVESFVFMIRDRAVGIATSCVWGGPWFKSRQRSREFLYSKTVQTGSGAHPAFCSVDTGVLFRDLSSSACS